MKRFLKNILAFAALIVPMALILPLTVLKEYRVYLEDMTMPEGKCVLSCSHSQSEVALDPDHFPELLNRSITGCPLEITALRIEDALSVSGGRCKVILLDVSPWTARFWAGGRAVYTKSRWGFSDKGFECLWWVHHPWEIAYFPIGYAMSRKKDLFRHTSGMSGGFLPLDEKGLVEHSGAAEIQARELIEGFEQMVDFTFDQWYVAECRRIAAYASERGCEVVFITTPLHSSVREKCKRIASFNEVMERMCRETGCKWLDYLEYPLAEDEWKDVNHVNRSGAAKLTRQVREDLASLGFVR